MAQSGFTPIVLFNSGTTTNAPTTSNLAVGELAINYTDGKLFYNTGSAIKVIAGVGGLASGSTTQVQYNNAGALAGSANFTFNGTTVTMANDASISGLTVGRGAGAVSTNTAVGASALAANTSGAYNTAFGTLSLQAITTNSQNTAVGYQALKNSTGDFNTAVGKDSARETTTGTANASFGQNALVLNTTGSYNVAVGKESLLNNTTASNNTAVGYQAAYSNTTGQPLIAIGYQTLYANTTGVQNVAVGNIALTQNTTGGYNTAIGHQSLYGNTTASNNTAVGYQAGYSNTTGTRNALLGYVAGYSLTGNYCTLIGAGAGYSTTGERNTFVGDYAGNLITTGTRNTIIGKYDGNTGGLDIRALNNYIVLSDGDGNPRGYFDNNGSLYVGSFNPRYGTNIYYPNYDVVNAFTAQAAGNSRSLYTGWYSASTTSTGTLAFNVTSNGNVTNTNNSYGSISDVKLKENIVDATPKLAGLMQVRVVNYNFKEGQTHKQIGVIAQELEQVFPAMVEETPDRDAEGNDLGTTTKSVKYSVFVPMLIKAIQELKAEFDAYKATHP
jgi:hypothetical protein